MQYFSCAINSYMTKQPLKQKHFFKAKVDLDCIAKRHVRFSPFPSFHIRQLTLDGRMKLNCSSFSVVSVLVHVHVSANC